MICHMMEQKATKRNFKKVATELDPVLLRKLDKLRAKERLSRADLLRRALIDLFERQHITG